MASPVLSLSAILEGLPLMTQGLAYTLALALSSFSAALVLGSLLGIAREEIRGKIGWLAGFYVELIRGIPLLLFLIFVHYGLLPPLLGQGNFIISSLVAFSLFEAAYVAEVVRGGLRSVTTGEREAARSLGLSRWQQFRHVILPLALLRSSPAMLGQFVALLKDTSLAAMIGLVEFTRAGEITYERNYHDFEILLFQTLVYFTICYGLSCFAQRFEPPEKRAQTVLSQAIAD